jgi:thiamine pyrophosphate-dependent acetolactate synthase large subunit-like protein
MADTVADLLVDRLIDWEVDTVFSLPGDGINGIFESLRRRPSFRGVSASVWRHPDPGGCIC